jgi:hypothetical protein
LNGDSRYLLMLRQQAATQLPPDFARQVIERSSQLQRRRGKQIRVMALTGVLCAVLVVVVHIISWKIVEHENLDSWAATAAQAYALEVSL